MGEFPDSSKLFSESGPSQPEVEALAMQDLASLSCSTSDCEVQCSVEEKNVKVQEKPLLKSASK